MPRTIQLSLLYDFNSPPALMYSFSEVTAGGMGPRLALSGRSLSSGMFMIDKFLKTQDILICGLYQLRFPDRGTRPERLTVDFENFFRGSLFEDEASLTFGDKHFLDEPVDLLDSPDSPFPGIPIWQWTNDVASKSKFKLRHLKEEQTFSFRAEAIVVPRQEEGSSSVPPARSYHIDPEMVVGPDDRPPSPKPDGR